MKKEPKKGEAWRCGYEQGVKEERERIEKILMDIIIRTLKQKKELDKIYDDLRVY